VSIRPHGMQNRPTRDWLAVTLFTAYFRHVPNLHGRIPASRDQPPAVRAERQADDETCVTAEGVDQLASVAVPDFHGAILPARGDPPAIVLGAERQVVDLPLVSWEGFEFFAGIHVPDLDRVLSPSRRQPTTVRAEGHVHTRPGDPRANGGAAGFLLLVEARRVPEHHAPVEAHRSQGLTVAAKDQWADSPLMGIEHAD